MTRDDTQKFFDRRVEAWRNRDFDALALTHTDDCVLDSPLVSVDQANSAVTTFSRSTTSPTSSSSTSDRSAP